MTRFNRAVFMLCGGLGFIVNRVPGEHWWKGVVAITLVFAGVVAVGFAWRKRRMG